MAAFCCCATSHGYSAVRGGLDFETQLIANHAAEVFGRNWRRPAIQLAVIALAPHGCLQQ